jgi:hypothetical protein
MYALSANLNRVRKDGGELENVKVAQASFCCTTVLKGSVVYNQISSSHNQISGSHNRTGSAPRGWPSFRISGNDAFCERE